MPGPARCHSGTSSSAVAEKPCCSVCQFLPKYNWQSFGFGKRCQCAALQLEVRQWGISHSVFWLQLIMVISHHHHPRISSQRKSWNKTSGPLCDTYYTTAVMSMPLWPIVCIDVWSAEQFRFQCTLECPRLYALVLESLVLNIHMYHYMSNSANFMIPPVQKYSL